MIKEITAFGKDVNEAKENARAALGVSELDDVTFEVLHIGSKGIFGIIGVKPAQVKASIEIPDREERRRPDRKDRKPRREQSEQTGEKSGEQTAERKSAEGGAAHSNNGKKKKKRGGQKSRQSEIREAINSAPSKPKSEVIPECELKLTLREVADGEDMSFDFIKTLILDTGLDAVAKLYSCDDGTRRITIEGADASVLIGHHGDTLDALQYLANLASARKNINGERDKSRVTIDIEGYRAKREETLRALARKMAAKALRNKRSVMLEPMSAYERRIIHSEIQSIEGVSTNSVGSDNNRKIVIFLNDKKPTELFEEERETPALDEAVEELTEAVAELDESVEVEVEVELKAGDESVEVEVEAEVELKADDETEATAENDAEADVEEV